jgi:hypothetical protein
VSPTHGWACGACARGGHRVVYYQKVSLQKNHLTKTHYRCSCGWIGVSIGSHRHHQNPDDRWKHQAAGDVPVDVEADAKPPGWMGI